MSRILNRFRKPLILSLCFLCTSSALSDEKIKLEHFDGEKYTLQKESIKYSNYPAYYGIYQFPRILSGGRRLYIFPDNNFSIAYFCDICPEEILLGFGTYKFENSKIIFKYKSKPKEAPKSLHVREGRIEKENYVTGDLKVFIAHHNLLKIKKKNRTFDYWVQIERYHEWRKVRDKLSKKAKKKESVLEDLSREKQSNK